MNQEVRMQNKKSALGIHHSAFIILNLEKGETWVH